MLGEGEFVVDVACGALFTIALSNKGRVFACGALGTVGATTLEEQIEKTKFREIEVEGTVEQIFAGLSGAAVITNEGTAYFWGKYGKININIPKKVEVEKKGLSNNSRTAFI